MLTIGQATLDLLSKLGFETFALASANAKQDVATALNGAMQTLWTAGEDYFTRQSITLTLSAGTAIYNVPVGMQAVLGPIRWNDIKPLRALESDGEYDQFARIFLGESGYGSGADGDPIAYFVDHVRSGSAGDICAVTIKVAPAPTAPAGTLVCEVINEPPVYAVADLEATTVLPSAQNYTESILLPIARYLVTRSSQFSRPDLKAQLDEDYSRAMARLGLAGGFPNVKQPLPPREVNG